MFSLNKPATPFALAARRKAEAGSLPCSRVSISKRMTAAKPVEILSRHPAGDASGSCLSARMKVGENMATLDWSKCPAVESIPGKVSGAWVFKDTRMPVSTVFENLESGASIDEIMEWFDVTREQIVAVLEFAARSLDAPPPANGSSASVDAHSL
jgi:uncharacterized protein (DUF433 family)